VPDEPSAQETAAAVGPQGPNIPGFEWLNILWPAIAPFWPKDIPNPFSGLARLLDVKFWIRVGLVIGGFILVIFGLLILAKMAGVSIPKVSVG
jgi:hypothetical protein